MSKYLLFCLIPFILIKTVEAQIWVNQITIGRPIDTYYLGDKLANDYFFNFEIGQETWNSSEVGIGQNADGSTGWDYSVAEWYDDGTWPNKLVRRDIGNFQFTNIGTWFVVGRAKSEEGHPWTYADINGWTDEQNLVASTSEGECPYFTVVSLQNPTGLRQKSSTSSTIEMEWTKWNGRNVMVVRKLAADSWTEPIQGTAYDVGVFIGDGEVVYNGNGISFVDDGLLPSTTYNYKFYSENYSYYSIGSQADGATLTTSSSDHFRSKVSGDWSVAGNWESSPNNTDWVTSTLVPGVNASSINILDGHDITLNTDVTVSSLTINSGATFVASDASTRTLTIGDGGTLTNNGDFAANSGTVNFEVAGTIQGTIGFHNVTLSGGGVDFGDNSTINGTLAMDGGWIANGKAPTYGSASILKYNNGGTWGRGDEWNSMVGAGYPNDVLITSSTLLDMGDNGGTDTYYQCAGNLTVDFGSTLSMNESGHVMYKAVGVVGDVTCNGTITLSSIGGGDLKLKGNLVFGTSSTFNANSRAIFFNGEKLQTVEATGATTYTISYIVVGESGGSPTTLKLVGGSIIADAPQGGNAISFSNNTDKIDLNGNKITIGTQGVNSFINGMGSFVVGLNSAMEILGNGDVGPINLDQSSPGTTNSLHDLTIYRTGGTVTFGNDCVIPSGGVWTINLASALTLTGNLTNNAGASGLVIKSDATGTGSLITEGTITGSATIERYIPAWGNALQGWHLLSSPVSSQAFQSTFVSDPPSSNEDFYIWDETTNTWINSKVGEVAPFEFNPFFGSNFVVGKGYLASYASESTKDFIGTPNTSSVSDIELTYSASSGYRGFNLLGNPYPSGLVWNIEAWKPDQSIINGVAKIISSIDASYVDIEAGEIIPSMNGFFVYTTEATTLSIPSSAKTHGGTWYKSPVSTQKMVLKAIDIAGGTAQRSVISINPKATMNFDMLYDGEFAQFYAPAFYSVMGDYHLSTNAIPAVDENLVIPFHFEKNAGNEYRIDVEGVESLGIIPKLLDKKTGVLTDLGIYPSYTFTSQEGDDPNRFEIHFAPVGISDQPIHLQPRAYVSGKQLTILGEGPTKVEIYDIQGRLLSAEVVHITGSYSQNLDLNAGLYIVRLRNGDVVSSVKVVVK